MPSQPENYTMTPAKKAEDRPSPIEPTATSANATPNITAEHTTFGTVFKNQTENTYFMPENTFHRLCPDFWPTLSDEVKVVPNNYVLLPADTYSELLQKISQQPSLQKDIQTVREKMLDTFSPPTKQKKDVIYYPQELELFCETAGAPTICQFLHRSVTLTGHSSARKQDNLQRTVAFIYTLCYCQS